MAKKPLVIDDDFFQQVRHLQMESLAGHVRSPETHLAFLDRLDHHLCAIDFPDEKRAAYHLAILADTLGWEREHLLGTIGAPLMRRIADYCHPQFTGIEDHGHRQKLTLAYYESASADLQSARTAYLLAEIEIFPDRQSLLWQEAQLLAMSQASSYLRHTALALIDERRDTEDGET